MPGKLAGSGAAAGAPRRGGRVTGLRPAVLAREEVPRPARRADPHVLELDTCGQDALMIRYFEGRLFTIIGIIGNT